MNEILDRLLEAYHRDRVDEAKFHEQLAIEFTDLQRQIQVLWTELQRLVDQIDRGEG